MPATGTTRRTTVTTMDGEVRFDPALVARGVSYLSEAGEALTRLQGQLGDDIESMSAARPWGNDDIGQAFQTNYDQIFPKLMQAWPKLGTDVSQYATAVSAVEDAAAQAEAAARQRMTW